MTSESQELFISPEDIAMSALEVRGFKILAEASDEMALSFELPTQFGRVCASSVDYEPLVGVVQVSIRLIDWQFSRHLYPGVYWIINVLHQRMPGTQFTLYPRDETDPESVDEIELSLSQVMVDDTLSTEQFNRLVEYAEQIVDASLPVFTTYVAQKLIFQVQTNGTILSVRERVKPHECLKFMVVGTYGRA